MAVVLAVVLTVVYLRRQRSINLSSSVQRSDFVNPTYATAGASKVLSFSNPYFGEEELGDEEDVAME
jgi:hypothetical protein